VAVQVLEVAAVPAAHGQARRRQAGRRLHPDDVGSPVGKLADAGGAGARDGQVDDADVAERKMRGHAGSPPDAALEPGHHAPIIHQTGCSYGRGMRARPPRRLTGGRSNQTEGGCPARAGAPSMPDRSPPALTDQETHATRATARPYILGGLASLSVGAAAIHFAVIFEHFTEYALYGVFFLVISWAQMIWAAVVLWRPSRLWLWLGLGGKALALRGVVRAAAHG